MKKGFPFYVIIVSLFIGVTAIELFSDGMFMDGLLYATISKNLAHGVGSFWNLHLTKTLYPYFHEHPPLAMGLQSIFFRLFGDSLFVERVFSLLTYLITGLIIAKIWKKISGKEFGAIAWLPLLLWISMPIVWWGCANNMLENTMMIFVALSVLYIIKSMKKFRFLNLFIAGIMLFLGFLTKGFVALFPWSFLFIIWMLSKKISFNRSIADTFILITSTIFPLLIIYIFNYSGIESLIAYIDRQVIGSLNNVQTVDSRFFIIKKLFNELIPSISIVIIVLIIMRIKKTRLVNLSCTYMFFLLGITGVLPIMISMKQSGFYILAAYPYFSIALALLISPYVASIYRKIDTSKVGFKVTVSFSIVLFVISILFAFMQTKKTSRDTDMLHDIYLFTETIPQQTTIGIPTEIYSNWSLHGYFARLSGINLDDRGSFEHQYYLTTNKLKDNIPDKYAEVKLETKKYQLFEKIKK